MSQVVQQLEVALDQQENKQVLLLNEITSGSDDFHPSISDEKNSVSKGKSPMASRHVQDPTSSVDNKTNSQAVNAGLPSVRRDVRKATTHKPLRLWPWDTFWNRVKRSKKNDFSSEGMLPTGQLVAVKRLSASFTQGLNEFKNEIHYLLNLQHRNIIKLLGYCIHRDEKLIVYEFMENASLYAFVGGWLRREQHPAWKVWDERRACDLVDESLEGAFLEEEALRCIQVGLLCT
ncbi:hypothetical protein OROHE_026543 [Orobanche hederae]